MKARVSLSTLSLTNAASWALPLIIKLTAGAEREVPERDNWGMGREGEKGFSVF
jgi:hypothetical protein